MPPVTNAEEGRDTAKAPCAGVDPGYPNGETRQDHVLIN